ncbi:MAG: hypothetical protein ABEL76_05930 [Bradymonadaceae bacterium]
MIDSVFARQCLCILSALAVAVAACEPASLTERDAGGTTDAIRRDVQEVAFGEVADLMRKNCTSSGCHGVSDPQGNFQIPEGANASDEQVASALRGKTIKGGGFPLVDPGRPQNSAIYLRLTGDRTPRMPLGDPLPDAEIKLVRNWIAGGAPYP